MAREKTLVLVFPPLTMPTSPPLGAAMLKGFIERELPGWRVKVLDLNLWTFEHFFAALASGRLQLDPLAFPEGGKATANLLRAVAVFRGQGDKDFYYRADLYDAFAELFLRFTETYTQMIAELCAVQQSGAHQFPIIEEFLSVILAEKPDAIGFSMIFNEQLPLGALLGKLLRQQHHLPVVFGGSCFADSAVHFLQWYPDCADVIIAGEGEDALKQLLTNFKDLELVPGAVYWKDGAIREVPKSYSKQIDYYGVPDFSDLELKRYFSPEPVIPLLLSRGCYWRRCTFCVHYRSAGLTYRVHSMDFTIDMLKSFVARGVRHFAFIDEMISPAHFQRLARAIKEAKLDIAYYALTKPTRDFSAATFAEMAESGCKYLLWGMESGCQRILDLMDKGSKVEEVSWVLRHAHAAGIANHVFMICGFPTETEAEFAQTLRFLDEHKDFIYAVHRGTFALTPESPIFREQQRFGITRSWLIQDTPTGGWWGYESASGMSQARAKEVLVAALPFLRMFHPHARYLANFRDHALLVYARLGQRLHPQHRHFPAITPLQQPMVSN